eukprot:COSAG02_NODE_68537_length_233_cov_3.185714_1_plen_62_part_01
MAASNEADGEFDRVVAGTAGTAGSAAPAPAPAPTPAPSGASTSETIDRAKVMFDYEAEDETN